MWKNSVEADEATEHSMCGAHWGTVSQASAMVGAPRSRMSSPWEPEPPARGDRRRVAWPT
jgi:hypothetical protein